MRLESICLACVFLLDGCTAKQVDTFARAPEGFTINGLAGDDAEVFFTAVGVDPALAAPDAGVFRVTRADGTVVLWAAGLGVPSFPAIDALSLCVFVEPPLQVDQPTLECFFRESGFTRATASAGPAFIAGDQLHAGRLYWSASSVSATDGGLGACSNDGMVRSIVLDGGSVQSLSSPSSFAPLFLESISTGPFVDDTGAYFIGTLAIDHGAPADGGFFECEAREYLLHLGEDGGPGDVLAQIEQLPGTVPLRPVADADRVYFVSSEGTSMSTFAVSKFSGVAPPPDGWPTKLPEPQRLGPGGAALVLDSSSLFEASIDDGGEAVVLEVPQDGGASDRTTLGALPGRPDFWNAGTGLYASVGDKLYQLRP